MRRIRQAEIPSMREIVPNLPAGLEELVRECLKPTPDDRIPSAGQLMAELRPYLESPPVTTSERLADLLIDLFPDRHAEYLRDVEHGLIRG